MKRWIRRILMDCSIALMVVATALWIRTQFAVDVISTEKVHLTNCRGISLVTIRGPSTRPHEEVAWIRPPDYYDGSPRVKAWPAIFSESMSTSFRVPHWLLIAVGAAYPTFAWLRHRRRKKDVGFPVEASAKE